MADLHKKHIYVSNNAPHLPLRLRDAFVNKLTGETTAEEINIKFVNGSFQTDNDEVAGLLDKLIETRSNISALVRKVDREAALRVVKAHIAEHNERNAMEKGPTTATSNVALRAMQGLLPGTERLAAAGLDEEAVRSVARDLAADHLTLTTKGTEPMTAEQKAAEAASAASKTTAPAGSAGSFGGKVMVMSTVANASSGAKAG